ncbi:MAG TPA: hypothetical protein VG502_07120 [Flexivirga sp.]|uniref:hypothetical protein n=1 Tax=Flexivirga sp. TaxID=1962927 RepID=UPI002B922164|nr:hypothetical protein [Flexivirga sp.]HWC22056.1 hypothetical protein [Flexivirga sp.]
MAINSVRTALQLLTGAGEVTRAKALEAAGTLLELPGVGETSARAGQLAEELIEAATANQAMVTELVRTELDRRLVVLGLARGSDLESAQRKIETLEAEVAALRAGMAKAPSAAGDASAPRADSGASRTTQATAAKATRKTAKKAAAASAKKTAAKKAATRTTTAKKTAAKKTATKKAAARTQ